MRQHHPAYHRLRGLQVGQQFIWPRTGMKFVIYVSNYGRRAGRKFRTRRMEFGRRVERLS